VKALTLWQPWSWAIAHAGKRVENRTWAPPASVIGQRVAIHAGLKLDDEAVERLARDPKVLAKRAFRMRGRDRVTALSVYNLETRFFGEPIPLVFGAVESVATIAGYVDDDGEATWRKRDGTLVTGVSSDHLRCHDARLSKWYMGPVGWVLDDVVALSKPVPCKGFQGLWNLPADVESAVLAQVPR